MVAANGRKWKTFMRKLKNEALWNTERNINQVWNTAGNVIKNEAVDIVVECKDSLPQDPRP